MDYHPIKLPSIFWNDRCSELLSIPPALLSVNRRIYSLLLQICDLFSLFYFVLSSKFGGFKTAGEFRHPRILQRRNVVRNTVLKSLCWNLSSQSPFHFWARSGSNPQYRAELTDRELSPNKIASGQVPGWYLMCFPSFLSARTPILLVKLALYTISRRAAKHAMRWAEPIETTERQRLDLV